MLGQIFWYRRPVVDTILVLARVTIHILYLNQIVISIWHRNFIIAEIFFSEGRVEYMLPTNSVIASTLGHNLV